MQPRLAGAVLLLSCFIVLSLACVSDDGLWRVNELNIGRDSLNYAEVSGVVVLKEGFGGGTTADVRYYDDGYNRLIVETSQTIGGDLEEIDTRQVFEITHYEVYVQPAMGGYERVCAEFRADNSNFSDWTQVGCIPAN
jgi:hypothetical protein